jgi:hypothetical protein
MADAILTMTFEATTDQLRLAGTSFHQPTTFGKCIGVSVEQPREARGDVEEWRQAAEVETAERRRATKALAIAIDALRKIKDGGHMWQAPVGTAAEALDRILAETKAST